MNGNIYFLLIAVCTVAVLFVDLYLVEVVLILFLVTGL